MDKGDYLWNRMDPLSLYDNSKGSAVFDLSKRNALKIIKDKILSEGNNDGIMEK